MTHRPYTPQQSQTINNSSHNSLSSSKHSEHIQDTYLTASNMVESHMILHIIEILGVFICAHKLWPKGVTYGEAEDWEKAHRKRHAHGASKSKSGRNGSSSQGGSSTERRRHSRYDMDDERPRDSRRYSARY